MNKAVSICDPYCVGLLKQHNEQKRTYFYNINQNQRKLKNKLKPSILNRFSFHSSSNSSGGNFTLFQNNNIINVKSVDQDFLSHHNIDIKQTFVKTINVRYIIIIKNNF